MLSKLRISDRSGFTLMEIIIAVAVVAVMAGSITPLVIKHLDSAKISRAQNDTETIATAVLDLYKDTGMWPYTRTNGPTGRVERLISCTTEATLAGTGAQPGAANWSTHGFEKQLGDFLYWNNPDDNHGSATGGGGNEAGEDYKVTGPMAWKGPYVSAYYMFDPWGNAYVINARYLPGGSYTGTVRHKAFVLSAGPDGKWQTGYADASTETITGDDIGTVLHISR